MVVCLVVRIRNLSTRTFKLIPAGDPFYEPKLNGKCISQGTEIPPGFDQPAEGLVVPWAVGTRFGLAIMEDNSSEVVRCVVGPSDFDEGGNDWLRLHSSAWDPIVQRYWLPLGQRHLLGAIGKVVELQLTLRDQHGTYEHVEVPKESVHFERESACAPANTIFLNVYDLASAASIPNAMFCNSILKTMGAFHAAVEVFGEEWGFYRQPSPSDCGICRSRHPRRHPVHVYRQSVNLGTTKLRDWEVWHLIREHIVPHWQSSRYNLIHCNCIHFADEFLQLLGASPVPAWVKGLHETGAAILKVPWPLSLWVGGDDSASAPADPDAAESEAAQAAQQTLAIFADNPDVITGDFAVSSSSDGKAQPAAERKRSTGLPDVNGIAAGGSEERASPSSSLRRPGFLPAPLAEGAGAGTRPLGAEDESPASARSVASWASADQGEREEPRGEPGPARAGGGGKEPAVPRRF